MPVTPETKPAVVRLTRFTGSRTDLAVTRTLTSTIRPTATPIASVENMSHQDDADDGARQPRGQRPAEPAPVDLLVVAHQRDHGQEEREPQQQVRASGPARAAS